MDAEDQGAPGHVGRAAIVKIVVPAGAQKRRIGGWYEEQLAGVTALERPPVSLPYADNIYWVYGVVLADDVPLDADEAMRRLGAVGIGTRPFFWPMHEQPALRKLGLFEGQSCPVAERIARRGFYVPSGVALTEDQVGRSAEALKRLLA